MIGDDPMKAQSVRLVDVFVLGPFMVWAGLRATTLPEWARTALVVSGILTVVYNGANYLERRRL